MSDRSFLDWLGKAAESMGVSTAAAEPQVCEPAPSPEVISGSSGVQYSYGGNTNETAEEAGDFGDGSRENATDNDGSTSNPMQSPGAKGTYALRYGIGFLCADYPGTGGDLADVAAYGKPKSAYLAAFKGMDKTKQYKNPTASQIVAGIKKWVAQLAKDLKGKGCAHGELVVSFQGHGYNGDVYGVDNKAVKSSTMLSIGSKAQQLGIKVTYVLDACFTGQAVPKFQSKAADDVDEGITNDVEGAGNVCSEENTKRANALRDQMAHARYLIQISERVGSYGDQLHRCISKIEKNGDEAAWNAAIALNDKIVQTIEALRNQFEHNMDFAETPSMRLNDIQAAFASTLSYLRGIEPFTCFDYDDWTGTIGQFHDTVSNGGNRIIGVVRKELDALE